MIIKKKRIIFIHIPKTGGSSIEHFFGQDTLNREKVPGKHKSLHDISYKNLGLLKVKFISEQNLDRYFKFTFVRNPWDLLLSHYLFYKKTFPDYVPATFEDFVLNDVRKFSFRSAGMEALFGLQYSYIAKRNGMIGVDYVGRFETLSRDFSEILKIIGENGKLRHLNKTEHVHYSEYYSKKMVEIVSERYKIDVVSFGYSFNKE